MKKQIDELVRLFPEFKDACKQYFEPNCGHVYNPLAISKITIYFDEGYNVFSTTINEITLATYKNRIEFPYTYSVDDFNTTIEIVKGAIEKLNNTVNNKKQYAIEQKKKAILKQLKELEQ